MQGGAPATKSLFFVCLLCSLALLRCGQAIRSFSIFRRGLSLIFSCARIGCLLDLKKDPSAHAERVFQLAKVKFAVMTNVPLDPQEAAQWCPVTSPPAAARTNVAAKEADGVASEPADPATASVGAAVDAVAADPAVAVETTPAAPLAPLAPRAGPPPRYSRRFRAALRVDPLLSGDWRALSSALAAEGFSADLVGARAYLTKWVGLMQPEYLMASTPHDFKVVRRHTSGRSSSRRAHRDLSRSTEKKKNKHTCAHTGSGARETREPAVKRLSEERRPQAYPNALASVASHQAQVDDDPLAAFGDGCGCFPAAPASPEEGAAAAVVPGAFGLPPLGRRSRTNQPHRAAACAVGTAVLGVSPTAAELLEKASSLSL